MNRQSPEKGFTSEDMGHSTLPAGRQAQRVERATYASVLLKGTAYAY